MFIEIDYSCIEKINTHEKYITFFNEMAYEIYKGKNYYYLSKIALEFLFNCSSLDNQPKEIYRKMFNNSYEDYVIKNSVNRKILVVNDDVNGIVFKDGNYKIHIDQFIEIGLPTKMNIIAENTSDCKFFINIGKAYKYKNNIKSVNIELLLAPGGGATIADVYTNKIDDNELSILFVDSDKKYCGAPFGGTINCLKNVEKELIKANKEINYVEIKVLDVHEIENLIPLMLIENYYSNKSEETPKKDVINFLKKFEMKPFDINNPIMFFDMKKGISLKKCEDNKEYKNFWKSVLENNGYIYDENDLIEGFGEHLLRKVNSYLEKNVETENFWCNNVNQYINEIWEEIGKLVYSFGCARMKKVC